MGRNCTTPGWPPTGDRLLRGLAHELSNRTGTIGAAAEALAAADPGSRLAAVLGAEATRLEALLRLLRLLAGEAERGAPEAVRPADLLADAAALLALHPDARDAAVRVEGADDAPPVRVRVPAVVRALVVLLEAAAGAVPGRAGAVVARCAAADDALLVTVAADAAPGAAPEETSAAAVRTAAALVAPDGGAVAAAPGGGATLSLPTLAALRRAERATAAPPGGAWPLPGGGGREATEPGTAAPRRPRR